MTDFRIVLPPTQEFTDRELDWSDDDRRWTVSDKEGGSVTWFLGRPVTDQDLKELAAFFEIDHFDASNIATLGPDQLASMHAQANSTVRVRATRCTRCNDHWLVFKWLGTDDRWVKYGRDCANGWFFSEAVSDEELEHYGIAPAQ